MSPLLYLIQLVVIIFSALTVCILCTVKLVQVSNGFSLLDPDISPGLRIRKWFLFSVAVASSSRCIACILEFVIFAITVLRESKEIGYISYYDNFDRLVPYVIFLCRVIPTLLYLTYNALLGLYLSNLSRSVRGLSFTTTRTGWITTNSMILLAVIQYLFFFPSPFLLNILCLFAVILYTTWILWSSWSIYGEYRQLGSDTAGSRGVSGVSNREEESLLGSSRSISMGAAAPAVVLGGPSKKEKILTRMCLLSLVSVSALMVYGVDYVVDLSGLFDYW
jgi:hypothetical protein